MSDNFIARACVLTFWVFSHRGLRVSLPIVYRHAKRSCRGLKERAPGPRLLEDRVIERKGLDRRAPQRAASAKTDNYKVARIAALQGTEILNKQSESAMCCAC